ncbi:pilin [Oscillibacter valericigenes]|nr:pilin [Oscillibacter valericigenes]
MLKKFTNKKGFTLMEMLIVVAIIAVLVAIAIPTFNNQLEKSRQSADLANVRAAYSEAVVKQLNGETPTATTPKMQSDSWDKVDKTIKIGGKNITAITKTKDAVLTITVGEDGKITTP